MNWVVLVRARAEQDLIEAHDWYEERKTGLGEGFLNAFGAAMRQLESNPHHGRL